MEIRHDGDAADIEGVLAEAFVARLWSLNVIDASQRVLNGRPLAELRPARGLLLMRAERLEQRFLRVNRDGASAARGRAGRPKRALKRHPVGAVPVGSSARSLPLNH